MTVQVTLWSRRAPRLAREPGQRFPCIICLGSSGRASRPGPVRTRPRVQVGWGSSAQRLDCAGGARPPHACAAAALPTAPDAMHRTPHCQNARSRRRLRPSSRRAGVLARAAPCARTPSRPCLPLQGPAQAHTHIHARVAPPVAPYARTVAGRRSTPPLLPPRPHSSPPAAGGAPAQRRARPRATPVRPLPSRPRHGGRRNARRRRARRARRAAAHDARQEQGAVGSAGKWEGGRGDREESSRAGSAAVPPPSGAHTLSLPFLPLDHGRADSARSARAARARIQAARPKNHRP